MFGYRTKIGQLTEQGYTFTRVLFRDEPYIIHCRHLYTNVVCRFEGKEFKSCNPTSLLIVWRTKRRNKRMQSAYADSNHTPCARMRVFYCNVA